MLIKEYRIPLPFTLEEYQRGQLWSVAEMSKNETGGGEGVEILEQKPFVSSTLRTDQTIRGIYTKKIYRLKSRVPYILKKTFPDFAFVLHEESWNAYPYTKTVLTNPDYMKENFKVVVESVHRTDSGTHENALNLTDLKNREVVFLDIADDSFLKNTDHNNVQNFKSTKTNRGPLLSGWSNHFDPLMTSYKVVSIDFKWFGLQNQIEKIFHKNYAKLFVKFHRQMFCSIDKWHDLTLTEIRTFEKYIAAKLKTQLQEGIPKSIQISDDEDDKK